MSSFTIIRRIVGLVWLSCLLVSSTTQALSFGNIGIVPDERVAGRTDDNFHYQLSAGATLDDNIKVINTSQTSQYINLAIESGHVSPNNTFSCQTGLSDSATWLKLATNRVLAGPGEVTKVKLSLSVPSNALPGEHNACLTAMADSSASRVSGVNLQAQIAFRIAINVPGQVDWELSTQKPIVSTANHAMTISIPETNHSPISLRSQTSAVYLRSWPESVKADTLSATVVLLPRTTANAQITGLSRPFWGGWYKLKLITTYHPDISDLTTVTNKTTSTTTSYIIWPKPQAWLVLSLIGCSMFGLIYGLKKYKNRRLYRLRRLK